MTDEIPEDAKHSALAQLYGTGDFAAWSAATQVAIAEMLRSGVTTYALHPGVVASDIWRRVPWPARQLMKLRMISPEQGARTSLYCATSPEVAGDTGLYSDDCRRKQPSAVAAAPLAGELWERSEAWVAA